MTEDIVDTPLPAEPRTKARSWDDPILYEAAVMRPQCTFITHWHSCRLDAGHPGRHSPGQLPAAPDPRPDLREALERIAAEGCQAYRFYDSPNGDDPSWDFCLHPDNRDFPLSGDVNEDRCWPCFARAALATTPPAPDRPVRIAGDDGPTSDVWTCSCGLTRPVTGSYGCADCGDGRPDSWDREPATPPAQPLPTEPDWGRMAYVLGLIGPVDTDDTEDAFVAYAEDIRAHYRRSDLETDSQYAAYVSRLSEARDE